MGWSVDGYHLCVLFLLYSPNRLSSVSVVFDFNASLNDFAPLSPIRLSVDLMRKIWGGLLMDIIYACSFFCIHQTDRVL